MKGHLQYIASEYTQEADDRGIRAISSVDGEIITEVVSILYNSGNTQLAKIVDKWKATDDEKILEALLSHGEGVELGEEFEETDEEGKKTYFIEIANQIFNIDDLFSIKQTQHYDEKLLKIVYCIRINELDESIASIKGIQNLNVILQFNNQDARDRQIDRIKDKLKKHRRVTFL